ncbi:PREDICTED: uncharacterized protein LOC108376210 [Rhagoletis zephyria]|uniref:uncharacterized protein LOC108376210 n=1 Tax=Rhagoletis zephyria TaxID=28612 RepID=UPI000811A8A4|nr:PREDICTED: uncharacterized protein LOC108376210 [Rhagoletis zephyria]
MRIDSLFVEIKNLQHLLQFLGKQLLKSFSAVLCVCEFHRQFVFSELLFSADFKLDFVLLHRIHFPVLIEAVLIEVFAVYVGSLIVVSLCWILCLCTEYTFPF